MKIKEVRARTILDSRNEKTIEVSAKTEQGVFSSSSPSGKSRGKYEKPSYIKNVENDISSIKKFSEKIAELRIEKFSDLGKIENLVSNKMGANTMIALEISVLKALGKEQGKELWQVINEKAKNFPFPVGNCIGGGLHTKSINNKKPDFQEFLIIPKAKDFSDNVFLMNKAWEICGKNLRLRKSIGKLNDENAFSSSLSNEQVLELINNAREELENNSGNKISIGVDIASSSFYTGLIYNYKNPAKKLSRKEQIDFVAELVKKYEIGYVEDPLEENDFSGFKKLREEVFNSKPSCLIVGDDLTASNLKRFEIAVKMNSINAVILKPNQIGSLIEISELVKLAKKCNIITVMSHRSGETLDYSLADLAFGFSCNYIKTGVRGKEREIKLKRMTDISKKF